ncbi:MAG: alpha/beta hydrolase [Deltaproteobacteria bacterium]|nr:alpha/beta hydrolase [Deltaproteobacteria bacterium]
MVSTEGWKVLYPYTGKFLDVDGGRLHYLDEGDKDGPVLLALHGNPTWSFYWRALIEEFPNHRVVIPDHIGCGLSDKPQDWGYRLAQHVSNVQALVEHLGLKNINLMVHDWGGAIGMGLATADPDRIQKLIITNTAAFLSPHIPTTIAMCRIPVLGSLMVRGGNAFAWVATWRATYKGLSKDVKEGLLFPYDSWGNRIATHRFVLDIPMKPGHPSYDTLQGIEHNLVRLKEKPMVLLWGDDDFCFSPVFRKKWMEIFPNAVVHAWDDVGHYVMEDARERVIPIVREFLN